jgi:predicted RNase H-like HicB family nuclease
VVFPDFAGATQGDDLEEAMSNAKEFLDSILAYSIDENLKIPEPTDIKQLQAEADETIISLIQGDPSPFIKKKDRSEKCNDS